MAGKNNKPTDREKKLLNFIGSLESMGGNYNIVYGGAEVPNLTNMTVKEVLAYQDSMIKGGSPSSAVGAHQIINSTLKEEIKNQKISLDTKFTPEIQDSIILGRLKSKRGLDKFLSGQIDSTAFAKNLSKEFASIPNPETGKSYYDGDGINKSLTDVESVMNTLGSLQGETIKEEDTDTSQLSSINDDVILSNPKLDDNQKEQLLKMNSSTGLTKSAIQLLNTTEPFPQGDTNNLSDIVETEVAMRKKVKKPLGHTEDINAFPADFKLLQPQNFKEGGLLNEFNTGGTHEENKHGGIPVSKNSMGGNNLVEEGETMYEKYIFSDSIKLDKKTADQFNIDDKYVGKTLAEVSKRYNAEIDDRPFDKITVGTARKELDKLILANESLKPSEPSSTSSSQFNYGGRPPLTSVMDPGLQAQGLTPLSGGAQLQGGAIPKLGGTPGGGPGIGGIVGAAGSALQMGETAFGPTGVDGSGRVRQKSVNAGMTAAKGAVSGAAAGTMILPGIGTAVGAALGAATSYLGANKKNKEINLANHSNTQMQSSAYRESDFYGEYGGTIQDPNLTNADVQSINQSSGINFTPQGANQLFQKLPGAEGPSGDQLNYGKYKGLNYFDVSKNGEEFIVNPTANNPHNPDSYRGVMKYLQSQNPNAKFARNSYVAPVNRPSSSPYLNIDNTQLAVNDDSYKYGGKSYAYGGNSDPVNIQRILDTAYTYNVPSSGLQPLSGGAQLNSNFTLPNNFSTPPRPAASSFESYLTPIGISGANDYNTGNPAINMSNSSLDLRNMNSNLELPIGFNQKEPDIKGAGVLGTAGNLIKKYGNDAMRVAPVLRNLLKKGPEAEVTSFAKLDSRYKPTYIDEANVLNRITGEAANMRRALTEASGGSQGALSANLLQNQSKTLQAVSDAMFGAQQYNAQQDQYGQTFNKDTDIRNQQIMTDETIANEQNRAAAQAAKDVMRNAAWEDIGNIGKEGKLGDILKKTTGYTPSGDKHDPNAGFLQSLIKQMRKENSPQYAAALEEYMKQIKNKENGS